MSEVLSGQRLKKDSLGKDKLTPEFRAELANLLSSAQIDSKLNEFKMLLFGGQVPEALDTFRELADALTADQTGLSALTQVVAGKATFADITSAVTALVGGAAADYNTLQKLEAKIKEAATAATNAVANDSVTNAKLGPDVKIGSLSAAKNAFTFLSSADRATLVTVEAFLVALASEVGYQRTQLAGQQTTISDHNNRLVALELSRNSQQQSGSEYATRITALESSVATKAATLVVQDLQTRVGNTESSLQNKASQSSVDGLGSRVATLEARPTGSTTPSGTQLTESSVNNSHLVQDIKAGSLADANSTLSTTAVSITGLVMQVYNKLVAQINQIVAQGGVAIEQSLASLSTTAVPSVKAVKDAIDGKTITPEQNLTSYSTTAVPSVRATKDAITAAIASSVGVRFGFGQRGNVAAGTISLLEAGTYTTNELQNISSHTIKKNGNLISYPVTFTQGDSYEITIVRITDFTVASLIWKP